MTGKTHRVGGVLCAVAGYSILQNKGMLLGDVNQILQLVVIYPFAVYGSTFSDLDHHWESAPSKDIVSWCINKILHLTTPLRKAGVKAPFVGLLDARHRSWQTHSDLFLMLVMWLAWYALSFGDSVAKLVSVGFLLGVISHMILDMLTPEGISSIMGFGLNKLGIKVPTRLRFVPSTKFFATGGKWEDLIRVIMWLLTALILIRIIYIWSPYRLEFNF